MRFFATVLFLATVSLPAQDVPKQEAPKQEAPKQAGGRGPQPPKNLKILKPEDIRATMGNFRIAMGQQCTFCHVMGDYASDENPKKEIARHMLGMVNEINAKFADGKVHVSCYTCHRGKTIPEMAPPPAPPPAAPAAQPAQQQ